VSCKPCPHHCPSGSGTLLAALGAVLTAAAAIVVGQVAESVFTAIVITSCVLGGAGIALFACLMYRDRGRPATSPARQHALTGRVVHAIPASAAPAVSAPRRSAAALPAAGSRLQSTVAVRAALGQRRAAPAGTSSPVRTSRTLRA
jgi:hypothetical protein